MPIWLYSLFLIRLQARVDEHGIWRRCIFWWHGWAWDRFRKPNIYQYGYVFHDKDPQWWRRSKCSLIIFPDTIILKILEVIKPLWNPPPAPNSAQALAAWPWAQTSGEKPRNTFLPVRINLQDDKIVLEQLQANKPLKIVECSWSSVRSIEIVRREHERPDYVNIFIHLDGYVFPVKVKEVQGDTTPQIFIDVIKRNVPENMIHNIAENGDPKSLYEAVFREKELAKQLKENKQIFRALIVCWTALPLLLTGRVLFGGGRPLILWDLVILGIALVPFGLLGLFSYVSRRSVHRDIIDRMTRIQKWIRTSPTD